jgi:predicted pyridoxine 5'-phosphate oxidase superfamily flavin-nucleotide-binding protein
MSCGKGGCSSRPFGIAGCIDMVRRAVKPILTARVRRFLEAPRVARLCTIGKDGYPHVVPIYFAREGDELIFGSDDGEAKVRNASRTRRAAVVIGGDPASDSAGYMIQGDLTVERRPRRGTILKLLRRYTSPETVRQDATEWGASGAVILRLKPRKVIRVW